MAANGYRPTDISNVSPFVRDVGQILLEDSSAFREIWAGMNHPKDEHGGGSGTTVEGTVSAWVQADVRPSSGLTRLEATWRRHLTTLSVHHTVVGLLLTDDDLASDLGSLNLGGGGNDT